MGPAPDHPYRLTFAGELLVLLFMAAALWALIVVAG